LDLELVDPGGAETISDRTGVIAPVEVQGADIGEQASVGDRIEGGFERTSLRLAPSIAQPVGRPLYADIGLARIGEGRTTNSAIIQCDSRGE